MSSEHLMIVIHSLRGGGAERVTADLASYWAGQGCRVSVVTQTGDEHDAYPLDARVTRHSLRLAGESGGGWQGLWANVRRWWALRRLIRRERPTAVLGMMTTASVLAVAAAGRKYRRRVFCVEHTHPPLQRLAPAWVRLRSWAYPRSGGVVALTQGTAQWLREALPKVSVTVIPNAICWPLAPAAPQVDPPPAPGRYRLLAVGRLHPVKGFEVLIEAFAEIADRFPQWDLTILGEGPARDALHAQIEEVGLSGRISLPGRVGNVADWYAASHLYVLSSRVEGFSNTLLEAMASGLAPVAFDCDTGPREIVRDGIDGVLVRPAGDAQALAAHLSDLMAHPERRAILASRAGDVRERYAARRVMAMWRALFVAEG